MKRVFLILFFSLLFAQDSLRQKLGEYKLLEHINGQVGLGYISFSPKDGKDENAFGIGGHLHIDTKCWYGLKANATFYTLQSLGLKASNQDFYGQNRDSVTMVSEANIEYLGRDLNIVVGRAIFDSPHADSDDIRMIPNAFEGIWVRYTKGFRLTLGYLTKMAGWESGGDIGRFKPLYEVLGVKQGNGMAMMGLEYDSLALWFYHLDNIVDIVYSEYSFEWKGLNIGIQIDVARDSAQGYLGDIDSKVVGMIVEYNEGALRISGAMNREFGRSGAIFSFGGGPYFTSMEDQTLDAIGTKDAKAYTLGVAYRWQNTDIGIMYGRFQNRDSYKKDELDIYVTGEIAPNLTLDSVYATIEDKIFHDDYSLFRVILKYGF